MPKRTLTEISRIGFISDSTAVEIINAGSLQRIASASEIMASNFIQLQNDREYYKRRAVELDEYN